MTWLIKNWRLVLAIAAAVAVFFALIWVDQRGYDRGYQTHQAEIAKQEKERTNAANRADDDARRCAGDPACLMSDDGYQRK